MTERKANGETEMKHFAAVEWSDFVKRLVSGDRRKGMEKQRGTRRKCYGGKAEQWQETGGLIQLLFDSFSQPALAGARSAAMRIRQMLYRAEPYQIDIQIEAQPERNRLVVTG